MKIWKMDFELDRYDNFRPKEKWTIEEIKSFDGRGHFNSWHTIQLERLEPEKGLPLSDAPGFYSHIPVFSERAVLVLKKYIDNNAEILTARYNEKNYYIINVTNVLNCINFEESEYKTFPEGNRIMVFEKYAFIKEKVIDQDLFKVREETVKRPFVSDAFRDSVINNGLTGFSFELVWECED